MPSGLRISRVIIRVTPFRVLRTLLMTHLPSPLGLQVGGRERSCQRRRLRRGFCKSSWFDRQSISEPRKSAGHPPCKRHFSAARMADDRFRKRVLRLCKRAERSISWIPRCSPHRSGRDFEGLRDGGEVRRTQGGPGHGVCFSKHLWWMQWRVVQWHREVLVADAGPE